MRTRPRPRIKSPADSRIQQKPEKIQCINGRLLYSGIRRDFIPGPYPRFRPGGHTTQRTRGDYIQAVTSDSLSNRGLNAAPGRRAAAGRIRVRVRHASKPSQAGPYVPELAPGTRVGPVTDCQADKLSESCPHCEKIADDLLYALQRANFN